MLYRLPLLFSVSFYLTVLLISAVMVLVGVSTIGDSASLLNFVSRLAIDKLTVFFFIYLLSCVYFFQNKLYFYTPQNKQRILLFGGIFAIIYLIIEYTLIQLTFSLFFKNMLNAFSQSSHQFDVVTMTYQMVIISANIWVFIAIAIVFYFMAKLTKRFFQIPLIDHMTSSHQSPLIDTDNQLNSRTTANEYRSFYAVIFASLFCCVANLFVWNIYFSILSLADEISMMVEEYYRFIFCFAFVSSMINYTFLVKVSRKMITRTYHWLPLSSLLTASAITLILFAICVIVMSIFVLPFVFAFKSFILFVIWFVTCYVFLYFLARFSLRRHFA